MLMKELRGTALYCGIGIPLAEMERHLDEAAAVGINAVFTSLQLPEADKDELLRDFPIMSEMAHERGMVIDADVAKRTATRFGIDLMDFAAMKRLGVDIMRLDGGYTDEQTVELTHNDAGMIIELNAVGAAEEKIERYEKLGINKEQTRFCHNYHPMRYTGLRPEQAMKCNDIIHRYGYRVGGFLASQTHQRIACSIGLPTLERHRNMPVFTAAQEAFLFGMDDLFIGDDLAAQWELRQLAEADPSVVTFRMKPVIPDGEITDWLFGRVLKQQSQAGLTEIIRSNFGDPESMYPGDCEWLASCGRRRGDVTICKKALCRYAGEVQIARMDLPAEEHMGLIGRVIDEDLPLLESFKTRGKFRFIRA